MGGGGGGVGLCGPNLKKAHIIIARNHYSQLASHEGPLSRCEINPSWAIMGHHGLFLTTDYNIWFLDNYPSPQGYSNCLTARRQEAKYNSPLPLGGPYRCMFFVCSFILLAVLYSLGVRNFSQPPCRKP